VSSVRLFPARVVRQEWARRTVTALSDSLDESGVDLMGFAIDPQAYDESPVALYVYRQSRGDASYTGLVCDVAVQAVAEGRVRGHEAVHAQRVEALVWHHATSNAPPAPVTLLHRAGPEFTRAIEATLVTPPILDFAGPRGLQQTVWRLTEGPVTAAVTGELGTADFYIADGHHRAAAALEEWRVAGKPPDAGLLCVIHPMDGLRLSAFHRRVSGPVDAENLLELLVADFDVREVARAHAAPMPGSIGLYVGRRWFEMDYRAERADGAAGLDVAILQARVLDRLVRTTGGRARTVETFPATTPQDDLTQWCDADAGALFTLAPPPFEALTRLADAGEVMPPKTTYFEPKPCAGIFLRP
jgi:uncharacterized protein (DUF1015 family)